MAPSWFDLSSEVHEQTFAEESRLSSLPTEWEREVAALWRLEADVNNGGYVQFLANWGRESYAYASQALKSIGAMRMAKIIDQCQALIDEHCTGRTLDYHEMLRTLPKRVNRAIMDLSYAFMKYPDDMGVLAMECYEPDLRQAGYAAAAEARPKMVSRSPAKLARELASDGRLTDRKCPHCNLPCPSYRRTCKYCGQSV